jgi:hypothetical protein
VRSTFDGEAGEELGTAVALSDDALVLAIAAPRFAGGAGRIQVDEWTGPALIRGGHVVGGTRSVSEGVVATLRSHGLEIERIAGDDRTSTAGAIARRMTPSRGTDLVVVDGYRKGEALAVGAAAIRLGAAVVYTSGSCRTSATQEIIDWWEPDRILLAATRTHLAQTLTAVSRDCDTEP